MLRLLLTLLLCPFLVNAQNAFGQNATWHYGYWEFGYHGFKKVSHIGDTTMHGMNWLKFSVEGVSELRTGPGPNDLIQDTARRWPDIFLATRNDSVFRLLDGVPFLLFDFNADTGDSWQFAPLDTTFGCTSLPIATVAAKGIDTLAGIPLPYMDLNMPMDSFYYNGQHHYQISSGKTLRRVYRDIGNLRSVALFEADINTCDGTSFKALQLSSHNIKCFSNGQINVNFSNRACNYWSLLNTTEESFSQLKIYPNPSSGLVKVEAELKYQKVKIFDLNGRLILEYGAENQIELPVKSGLYILKVEFENGASESVRIQRL